MSQEAAELAKRDKYGIISKNIPLISNLSLLENIEVVIYYHNGDRSALDRRIRAIEMVEKMQKREPNISNEERFCAMHLRAISYSKSILFLRPFSLLTDHKDILFADKIFDATAEAIDEITIFDFEWNKQRYGDRYVQKS